MQVQNFLHKTWSNATKRASDRSLNRDILETANGHIRMRKPACVKCLSLINALMAVMCMESFGLISDTNQVNENRADHRFGAPYR